MPYLTVENFKYGLDSRRAAIAAQPGTLTTCENGHINQGGEFEKRKAFVRSALPASTFGLQETSTGLVTFGSTDLSASFPVAIEGFNVTYQRLRHPAVAEGGTDSAMTAVVCSTAYGGKAWVAATFADGATFVFYDGSPCSAWTNGVVLSGLSSISAILDHLATYVNTFATYHAEHPTGANYVDIWGDATFTLSEGTTSSAAGSLEVFEHTWSANITAAAVATKIVTITTASDHGLVVGNVVNVDCSESNYDATEATVLSVPTGNTFTFFKDTGDDSDPTATGTVTLDTYAVAGTASWGSFNLEQYGGATANGKVTSVMVDGLELLPIIDGVTQAVNQLATDDATAAAVVAAINTNSTTPAYVATNPSTSIVKLTANVTEGATPNGRLVQVTVENSGDGGLAVSNSDSLNMGVIGLGQSITSITYGGVELLTGTITRTEATAAEFATTVSTAINANSATSGFVAQTATSLVRVCFRVCKSDNTSNVAVVVTTSPAGLIANHNYKLTTGTYPFLASFKKGVDAVLARAKTYRVRFYGTWAQGDTYELDIVTSAATYNIGATRVTEKVPTYAMTFKQKLNFLAGTEWFFSAVDDPTGWGDSDVGAGKITPANYSNDVGNLISISVYQGKLAIFADRDTLIFDVGASPTLNYSLSQAIGETNALAKLGVQALGELDTFFINPAGFRSLRARETSLNAFVTDVGSAIDLLVQELLSTCTAAEKTAVCAVVEPSANRILFYVPNAASGGKFYALSYFYSSKIVAWSSYQATYDFAGTQTAFVPQKMLTYSRRCFIRTSDAVLIYSSTYDAAVAVLETPWLDAKTSAQNKPTSGVDAALTGAWKLSASMDPLNSQLQEVYNSTDSTFDLGRVPFESIGTHLKMRAETTGATAAKVSALSLHYRGGDQS